MPFVNKIGTDIVTISIPPFIDKCKVEIIWYEDKYTHQNYIHAKANNITFDGSLRRYLKYFNKADNVPTFFYCNHIQNIGTIETKAKCNPDDVFDYDKGKKIALMRLKKQILLKISEHYNKMRGDLVNAFNIINARACIKLHQNIISTQDYIDKLTK